MMPPVSIVNVSAAVLSFSTVWQPVHIHPAPAYSRGLASATLPLVTPIAKVFHITIVPREENRSRRTEAWILSSLAESPILYVFWPAPGPRRLGMKLLNLGSKLETNVFLLSWLGPDSSRVVSNIGPELLKVRLDIQGLNQDRDCHTWSRGQEWQLVTRYRSWSYFGNVGESNANDNKNNSLPSLETSGFWDQSFGPKETNTGTSETVDGLLLDHSVGPITT